MSQIRVRFAPSPTGHLHVGSLRVALFNWLFARHNDGTYLVRIEDTDPERSRAEYTAAIVSTLRWASLESDEPLVIQSQHVERHHKMIDQLLAQGHAYRCWCTREQLEQRSLTRHVDGTGVVQPEDSASCSYGIQYDGYCRTRERPADDRMPFVVRFRLPDDLTEVMFEDLIRGPISTSRDQLDDFILVRSDGTPVYNFVVVVDDACMEITHVLRGDDHIANTPKQLLLYRACGLNAPHFGHLPQITTQSGQRLSKREGAVAVEEFRREGFLADALVNYLVRLGWSHGDQEIFSRAELIRHFSLEGVGVTAAVFDRAKLEWMNGMYMRKLSGRELLQYITQDVDPDFVSRCVSWSRERLECALAIYVERAKTLGQLVRDVCGLCQGPEVFDDEVLCQLEREYGRDQLSGVLDVLSNKLVKTADSSHIAVMALLKSLVAEQGVPFRALAQPIRVAVTGSTNSPGVAQLIELIGIDETVRRLQMLKGWLFKGD